MTRRRADASQVQALVALQRLPVELRRVVCAEVLRLALVDALPDNLYEVSTRAFRACFDLVQGASPTWYVLKFDKNCTVNYDIKAELLCFNQLVEKLQVFRTLCCGFFVNSRPVFYTLTRCGLGWQRIVHEN
jgi:hypothetical protein